MRLSLRTGLSVDVATKEGGFCQARRKGRTLVGDCSTNLISPSRQRFVRPRGIEGLQRCGHRVWLDLKDIEKGGCFEVRIEEGLRQASVVAAVLTPASVREQSVCSQTTLTDL